jgi:hypothetical protein
MTHPAHYDIIGGGCPDPDRPAALAAALARRVATRRDQVTAGHPADMRQPSADTPGNGQPDPTAADPALIARTFLQALGDSLDEAWPELIARACSHAGMGAPIPGADAYVEWLAAALGVPVDEAPFELDQLLPGLPVDTRGHADTRGHEDPAPIVTPQGILRPDGRYEHEVTS